jgi:hypothetical protein
LNFSYIPNWNGNEPAAEFFFRLVLLPCGTRSEKEETKLFFLLFPRLVVCDSRGLFSSLKKANRSVSVPGEVEEGNVNLEEGGPKKKPTTMKNLER